MQSAIDPGETTVTNAYILDPHLRLVFGVDNPPTNVRLKERGDIKADLCAVAKSAISPNFHEITTYFRAYLSARPSKSFVRR